MATDFEINARINDLLRNITPEMDSDYLIQLCEGLANLALPKNAWQNFPASFTILPKLIENQFFDVANEFIQLFEGHHLLLLSRRENAWSALGCALNAGAFPLAKTLVKKITGLTPKHLLARFWEESCPKTQKRILHLATAKSSVMLPLIDFIKDEAVNIHLNAMDQDWNTPLHLAAQQLNVKVVVALIQAGADIAIRNKQNQTVFDFLCDTSSARNASVAIFNHLCEIKKAHFINAYFDHIKQLPKDSLAVSQFLSLARLFSLPYDLKARVALGFIELRPEHEDSILRICNDAMVAHYRARKSEQAIENPAENLIALQYSDRVFERMIADFNKDIASLKAEWRWIYLHRFMMIILTVGFSALSLGVAYYMISGQQEIKDKGYEARRAGDKIWDEYNYNNPLNLTETEARDRSDKLFQLANKYFDEQDYHVAIAICCFILGLAIASVGIVVSQHRWDFKRTLKRQEAINRLGDLPDELTHSLKQLDAQGQSPIPTAEIQSWENQVAAMKESLPSDEMAATKQASLELANTIRVSSFNNQAVLFKPREICIDIVDNVEEQRLQEDARPYQADDNQIYSLIRDDDLPSPRDAQELASISQHYNSRHFNL